LIALVMFCEVLWSPLFVCVKGPAADATDASQPWGLLCNPVMKMERKMIFFISPSNGTPVEWNWQGKTEVLGEKPVAVPLCPPEILHGSNPGLRGERPATNRLNHGTAKPFVMGSQYKNHSIASLPCSFYHLHDCSTSRSYFASHELFYFQLH
jgi:hypothetical protein